MNAKLKTNFLSIQLNVALDVISIASASVFLNVDADVTLDLSFEGGASVTAGNVNSEFQGCFDVGGGVSVNAGAEGSLAGLFSDDTEFTIFSKTFDLFEVSGVPPISRSTSHV